MKVADMTKIFSDRLMEAFRKRHESGKQLTKTMVRLLFYKLDIQAGRINKLEEELKLHREDSNWKD